MKRCVLALAGLIGLVIPAVAEEIVASPWLDFREARVRLLSTRLPPKVMGVIAGLEIRLAPGFKTYWRTAGDSGVPPMFDFSASSGVRNIEVHFPFPSVFDDGAGGKAWGYKEGVILPILAKRETPDYSIKLKLDFAVCGTMCIPLSGEITLDPIKATPVSGHEAQALDLAMLALPTVEGPDAAPPISILRTAPPDPPIWALRIPYRGDARKFFAFPEAQGFLEMTNAEADGDGFIKITLSGQAAPGSGGKFGPVRLTYGRPGAAFERMIDLDGATSR
ncbi:MAG: hypothetical protein CFE31_09380 [Rhizobiales bacterium PAR1]|nr:MAG: hypothetical protein CFE31_09380 [Rhizobiales bacterium PAR1]